MVIRARLWRGAVLAAWLLAGQVVPALHLATHRDGHSHGPDTASRAAAAEASPAPHRAPDEEAERFLNRDASGPVSATGLRHRAERTTGHNDHEAPDRRPPGRDHGAGSAAHFALAVVDAPPCFALPAPDWQPRAHVAPPVLRAAARLPRLSPARAPPA